MKMLRLAGLGIAIWALSLVWTEVNLVLTPSIMVGLVLGLGAVAAVYTLGQRRCPQDTDDTSRHTHPTRPIPVLR